MKENALVDDQGTSQEAARGMMEQLVNANFDGGGLEHLSLIMGRPQEELQRFLSGEEPLDDDFVMKMRGVAQERGVDLG